MWSNVKAIPIPRGERGMLITWDWDRGREYVGSIARLPKMVWLVRNKFGIFEELLVSRG
jgi:hypothetical protein